MALVTSEKMLADAQKGNYAVGAFNVENMEMVKAVLAAAEELHAPVMEQWKLLRLSLRRKQRKYLFRYVCIWIMEIVLNWLFRQ